jgi:hypothetical protein
MTGIAGIVRGIVQFERAIVITFERAIVQFE